MLYAARSWQGQQLIVLCNAELATLEGWGGRPGKSNHGPPQAPIPGGIGRGGSEQAVRTAGQATHEPTALLFSVEKTHRAASEKKKAAAHDRQRLF